ncbi:hypothetical protein MRB53_040077 [Persea americana]|nr:hypothetical protein MRB53_040077 [Persea americana]
MIEGDEEWHVALIDTDMQLAVCCHPNPDLFEVTIPDFQKPENMSAPNQGRQSPDPEKQSDKQLHEPVSKNPNDQGAGSDSAQKESANTLKNLESNPKHPLDDAAAAKTSKTVQ